MRLNLGIQLETYTMDHIESIKAFVTVVRLESFTKAARQLNMSSASLSRAVSSLESRTQTRLVNRSTRFVSLAPGAREYFDVCVDVLDRLHEGEQRLLEDRTRPRGELRIAAHPLAIEAGLPKLVGQFQQSAPEVEIVLNMRTGPMRLEHENYDVAVYPPNLLLDPEAICRRILTSPIVLVASPAWLDQVGFDSSKGTASGHTILCCHGDAEVERVLRLECDGQVTTLGCGSVRMSVSECTALRLALSGFGMASLPEFLAAPYLANGKLQRVFPDHRLVGEPAVLGVAYMRHRTIAHRIRSFVDTSTRFFSHEFAREGRETVRASIGLAA
jgi:DNA-binding transcriptional LysR family regulator